MVNGQWSKVNGQWSITAVRGKFYILKSVAEINVGLKDVVF
jgi:hypothetical protein